MWPIGRVVETFPGKDDLVKNGENGTSGDENIASDPTN